MAQTPVIGIPTPDEYMIGRTVAGYMRYGHADEQDALCSNRGIGSAYVQEGNR